MLQALLGQQARLAGEAAVVGGDALLPDPLPAQGSVTLHLERLGVLGGQYQLDLIATDVQGLLLAEWKNAGRFAVSAAGKDSGLIRPVHRWSTQLAPREQASAPLATGT